MAQAGGRAAAGIRRADRRGGRATMQSRARRRRRGRGHAARRQPRQRSPGRPRGCGRAAACGPSRSRPRREVVAHLERLRGRALLRARGAEGVDALRAAVDRGDRPGRARGVGARAGAGARGPVAEHRGRCEVYETALATPATSDDRTSGARGRPSPQTQHLSTLPRGIQALGATMQRPSRPDAAGAIVKAALALATTARRLPGRPARPRPRWRAGTCSTPSRRSRSAWRSPAGLGRPARGRTRGVGRGRRAGDRPQRAAAAGVSALTFRGGVHLRAGRLADAEADLRCGARSPAATCGRHPPCRSTRWRCSRRRCWSARTGRRRRGAGRPRARRAAVGLPGQQRRPDGARPDSLGARPDRRRPSRICSSSGAAATPGRCATRPPFPWRSQAAIALRATDPSRARELAEEELELARAFGAAGAHRRRPAGGRTRPRRRPRASRCSRRPSRRSPPRPRGSSTPVRSVDLGAAQRRRDTGRPRARAARGGTRRRSSAVPQRSPSTRAPSCAGRGPPAP